MHALSAAVHGPMPIWKYSLFHTHIIVNRAAAHERNKGGCTLVNAVVKRAARQPPLISINERSETLHENVLQHR
jgi:hypothetical protein